MGEAEIFSEKKLLIIHSVIYFYGNAASDSLSLQVAADIENHWNEPKAKIALKKNLFNVTFLIKGIYIPGLAPEEIYENTNARNNYFRIEKYAHGNISFVDGLGSNSGYFKLENLLNNSTTAAHEYGHTLGLDHPKDLDIRGFGQPSIMYPRGTLVDPQFQYDSNIPAGLTGGTMNPFTRKVFQEDIDLLNLPGLNFNNSGFATVGVFSSVWHNEQKGNYHST